MYDKHALPRLRMNICSQIFQDVNWIWRSQIGWDDEYVDFETLILLCKIVRSSVILLLLLFIVLAHWWNTSRVAHHTTL